MALFLSNGGLELILGSVALISVKIAMRKTPKDKSIK